MGSSDPERVNDATAPEWFSAGATTLTFHITTALGRLEALERRDAIVAVLADVLGLRLSFTQDGVLVHMADRGAPTAADMLACAAGQPVAPPGGARCCAVCGHSERGHKLVPAPGGTQWPPEVLHCPQCRGSACVLGPGHVVVIGDLAAMARSAEE